MITAGGLDLSVGSMVAFVASLVIIFLNTSLVENQFLFLSSLC